MYRLLAIVLVLFAFSLSPCQAKEQEVVVKEVIDGDTIVLENGDIVHYLGVKAPQLRSKEGGGEFYAREAFRQNKSLVQWKKVRLEFDVEKKDHEGRLLAYVYVKNLFVNAELVRLGFARANVTPPNLKHKDLLLRYEKEASEKYAGLWQEGKEGSEPYYVGNKRTYVFHKPNCPLVAKIPEKSRIIFRSRTDPIKIGYVPCKKCKP
jgi:endonuclease YncB( thermonuclease family)